MLSSSPLKSGKVNFSHMGAPTPRCTPRSWNLSSAKSQAPLLMRHCGTRTSTRGSMLPALRDIPVHLLLFHSWDSECLWQTGSPLPLSASGRHSLQAGWQLLGLLAPYFWWNPSIANLLPIPSARSLPALSALKSTPSYSFFPRDT